MNAIENAIFFFALGKILVICINHSNGKKKCEFTLLIIRLNLLANGLVCLLNSNELIKNFYQDNFQFFEFECIFAHILYKISYLKFIQNLDSI